MADESQSTAVQDLTGYEELPYESNPFSPTHPDRLALLAHLYGLKYAAVEHCRVLELGCAVGGNLIPMALCLPGSHFVGIDLSPRQIADGNAVVASLGLRNVTLKAQDLLKFDKDIGLFDYIICHGVYSWVPPNVQEKILDICAQHLTADGLAYISYNTFPGWKVRHTLREILYYRASRFPDPRQRVREARALLEVLAQSTLEKGATAYPAQLRGAVEVFRKQTDTYLLHEYFEEYNEPLYFHQFAERITSRGLAYLTDALMLGPSTARLSPEIQNVVRRLSKDRVEQEQYLDFLRNQAFRRSILCRRAPAADVQWRPELLAPLHIASPAQSLSSHPNLAPGVLESFRGVGNIILSAEDALVKAALLCLGQAWPRAVHFDVLLQAARGRLKLPLRGDAATEARDTQALGSGLLDGFFADQVEFHVYSLPCARAVGERPVASPLARYQAASGNRVTNLRHTVVELTEAERQLLVLLDGSRGVSELAATLNLNPAAGPSGQRMKPFISAQDLGFTLSHLNGYSLLVE